MKWPRWQTVLATLSLIAFAMLYWLLPDGTPGPAELATAAPMAAAGPGATAISGAALDPR